MTRREAAIITAYTGILIGYMDDFYEYVSELYGRPVYTHELPYMLDDIANRSRGDFYKLNESIGEDESK